MYRSFDDVLAGDYKVITLDDSVDLQLLKFSIPGSAKRTYYETKMKDDPSALYESEQEMIQVILDDPKVLMWLVASSAAEDKRIKPLNILDSVTLPGAYAYPKGSEFRRMFNYHLMKIRESGIRMRIEGTYLPEPPLKIGVDEAQQLGYDVILLPTMILMFGGLGSWLIAVVECLLLKCGIRLQQEGQKGDRKRRIEQNKKIKPVFLR